MSSVKWWGTPLNLGSTKALQQLNQPFPGESTFAEAEPITVRIRGVMIREDKDALFAKDNDIIINTTFQFGNEPPVQRLHFMKNNVPLAWVGDFFHDVILSTRDFKDKILTLRIQVYDLDGVSNELVNGVRMAAASSIVAFPYLALYAGTVAFAAPMLLTLINNLDEHDRILDERIKLEVDAPGTGHKLLQPGYFVCFKEPVASGLSLNQDLRIVTDRGKEFRNSTYVVLEIAREFHVHSQWEIDQKVAKLVAELNGKGQSGKAALEFLRDTLDGYTKFKKLQRAHALQNKQEISIPEQQLLDEILADQQLAPFLSA